MSAPTRYPNGVTNSTNFHPLKNLPVMNHIKYETWHEDFKETTRSASGVTGWHLNAVGTTDDTLQPYNNDTNYGSYGYIFTTATSGDNQQYQWANNTTPTEPFRMKAGKEFFFETKFLPLDVDGLWYFGVHITRDDPWNTEPSDQAAFRTLAADPDAIQFAIGKTNSTEQTIALGNLTEDAVQHLGFYYDGKDTVTAWRSDANDVVQNIGSVTVTNTTTGDLLPDTAMTISFGAEAYTGGSVAGAWDYFTIVQERE